MSREVRVGVIGIGNMGTSHSRWLMEGKIPGAKLSAVCDIDEKRRVWAKENLGTDVAVYEYYEEMLQSGNVDAVIIAVPH